MKNTKALFFLFILITLLIPGIFLFASEGNMIVETSKTYAFWAFLLGGLSAVSLPLGSIIGIVWQPGARLTASLTAFGAGALLAALSVELIAPTVMEFVGQIPGILSSVF